MQLWHFTFAGSMSFGYFQLAQMRLLSGANLNSWTSLGFSASCFQLHHGTSFGTYDVFTKNARRILDAEFSVVISSGNLGTIKAKLTTLISYFHGDQDVRDGVPIMEAILNSIYGDAR